MNVSIVEINKLRACTGAGISDCKKALELSSSYDDAIIYLRKKSQQNLEIRSDRSTNNGKIFVNMYENIIIFLTVRCETDFVANSKEFIQFGNELSNEYNKLFCNILTNVEYENKEQELLQNISLRTKENISIALEYHVLDKNTIMGFYLHHTKTEASIFKISLFENIEKTFNIEELIKIANNIAMHIVANKPKYLSISKIPYSEIEIEKEIIKSKLIESDKPEKLHENIINGQLKKFYQNVCLLEQDYILDKSYTVQKYINSFIVSSNIKDVSFCHYKI